MQLRQPRRIAVDVGRQELQRDRLAELQIVRAVHLAHPAAADAFDDAIAAAEERAGREASVIDRARAREPACGRGAATGARAETRIAGAALVGGLTSGRRLRQPGLLADVGRHRRLEVGAGKRRVALRANVARLFRYDNGRAGGAGDDIGHGVGE